MRGKALAALLILLIPYAAGAATGTFDVMPDGFVIRYHLSDTDLYPGLDAGTFYDLVREATRDNYAEFLGWGLVGDWPGEGHVYLDDQRGAQCNACVLSGTDFQIHMSHATVPRIELAPTDPQAYADDEAAFRTILGHEMFHNFQNAYVKPTGASTRMNSAFTEGLARMQETAHGYSWVSHQPDSLVYTGTVNGCNNELAPEIHPVDFPAESPVQWVADAHLRDGPTTDQTYSACSFWLAWFGTHGTSGIAAIFEEAPVHREKSGWQEEHDILENVSALGVDGELAHYAASALTGSGLAWGGLDWGEHLGRWEPPVLAAGGSLTDHLRDGGMMGARLDAPATVSALASAPITLWHVDDAGDITPLAQGASVAEPGWVVVILPGVGESDVTLTLT